MIGNCNCSPPYRQEVLIVRSMIIITTIFCNQSLFAFAAETKPTRTKLKVGDKAPTFAGKTDENKDWDSNKHAGKNIYVVYFYPADMTPGCTKQACSYRDALADLKQRSTI